MKEVDTMFFRFFPKSSALYEIISQLKHADILMSFCYSVLIFMTFITLLGFLKAFFNLKKKTLIRLSVLIYAITPAVFLALVFNSETFSLVTTIISFVALLWGPVKNSFKDE